MSNTVAIIGLGYVGLPLGIAFSKKGIPVIGYDTNKERIRRLSHGEDHTLEVTGEELVSTAMTFTHELQNIALANIFIVTVPTPVDEHHNPDLNPLKKACASIGTILKKGDIVIFESTVFPGCTEEECVPVLEEHSNLVFNKDFFCGYSPERISPGDTKNTLNNIVKITSGSTPEISELIDALYKTVIDAGTYKAPSIKVAEAAKVIENVQRDLNISLMNELALLFDKLDIDTQEVLQAAKTKWNFLPFSPGLVGGHCISVDPYYLTHKAESVGYYPEVILSGRRINDQMSHFVANKVIKLMIRNGSAVKNASVLVLGITFKENIPDIRNSKVIDVIKELNTYGVKLDVHDSYADPEKVVKNTGIQLTPELQESYDAIILAVPHRGYIQADFIRRMEKMSPIIFDVKGVLPKNMIKGRL